MARARAGTAATRSRGGVRRWIPPQHGVWAMLLLPYLAGLQYGLSWLHVPLLVVWLSGWLASHFALLTVKTLRVRRHLPQMTLYAAVSALAAIPLFVARPGLLWFSPIFAVLLGMNVVAARLGQERATGNGVASVTMAALMAMIAPATAGLDWRLGIGAAIVTWLYLVGSVFYVKTMIRERGSRVHRVLSAIYHVVALVRAAILGPWLAVPFGVFLARAVVLPRYALKVPVVGAIEVMNTVMLLGFVWWRL